MDFHTPLISDCSVDSCPPLFHRVTTQSSDVTSSRLEEPIPEELYLPRLTDSVAVNKRPMFHLRPRLNPFNQDCHKKMKLNKLWIDAEMYLTLSDTEERPVVFTEKDNSLTTQGSSPSLLRPRVVRKWVPRLQDGDGNRETKTQIQL